MSPGKLLMKPSVALFTCCLIIAVVFSAGVTAMRVHKQRAPKPTAVRPLSWYNLHLNSHRFVGQWHGQHYQAEVWARSVCLNHTHHMVRMLVSIHDSPYIRTINHYGKPGPHSETPHAFKTNTSSDGASILPKVWFEGSDGSKVFAIGLHWDAYRARVTSGAMMAVAELQAHVPYTIRLQGSDRVHHLSTYCTPKQHPMFAGRSTWVGIVEVNSGRWASPQPTAPPKQQVLLRNHRHLSMTTHEGLLTAVDGSSRSNSTPYQLPTAKRPDHIFIGPVLHQSVGTDTTVESKHSAGSNGSSHSAHTATAAKHGGTWRHLSSVHVQRVKGQQWHTRSISYVANGSWANTSSWDASASLLAQPRAGQRDLMQFLVLQHWTHHMSLGFTGSLLVVTPHTANSLLQDNQIRDAVRRRELVLITWDSGLEPNATHFIQLPAVNLLRLAAWGSNASLAFFDLDEYLVLPQHRSVAEEITHGCLTAALSNTHEAIIHSSWVRSRSWEKGPEALGWLQHGSWPAAVKVMDYEVLPYRYCDGVCKAVINPNADMVFQVHQHTHPSPKAPVHQAVSRTCAYLLHFHNLWVVRVPTDAYSPGQAGAALELQHLALQAAV